MTRRCACLFASISLKLLARSARVVSIVVNAETLIIRAEPAALYDRVSLYRAYGTEARISTNVLRIPRRALGTDWIDVVRSVLEDMIRLRQVIEQPTQVGA